MEPLAPTTLIPAHELTLLSNAVDEALELTDAGGIQARWETPGDGRKRTGECREVGVTAEARYLELSKAHSMVSRTNAAH